MNIQIRLATPQDHTAIWEIFHSVIQTGDTFVFSPNLNREEGLKNWIAPYIHTYVALIGSEIAGTYIMKKNQPGLGSHIANASYMVSPKHQGKGIGKLMAEHSLKEANILGFKAMQFNIVVSTNKPALNLWEKMGFNIIGTIPKGFKHQTLGYVDAHIMYQELGD